MTETIEILKINPKTQNYTKLINDKYSSES